MYKLTSPKNVAIRKSVSTATFRFVELCFRTTLAPFYNGYTRVKKKNLIPGQEMSYFLVLARFRFAHGLRAEIININI